MTTPTKETKTIGDYAASWIRTTVPILWGVLLTQITIRIPCVHDFLQSQQIIGLGVAIAGAITTAWYSLWRKIEPKLPPWMTRIVLGSNTTPIYVTPPETEKND